GLDTEKFIEVFLRDLKLDNIQLQNYGGNHEMRIFLAALRNAPEFKERVQSLGIIRDAEADATAAFQSVCDVLEHVNLDRPVRPEQFVGNQPRVGIFLFPDGSRAGMLETLCLEAIGNDPVIECVIEYFDCVKRKVGALPNNLEKARLRTFLASRPRPHLQLARAIDAGYIPCNSSCFDGIKNFLRSL